MVDKFRSRIIEKQIEQSVDATLDIRGVTLADLETKPYLTEREPITIYGVAPSTLLESYYGRSTSEFNHDYVDASSKKQAENWVELIQHHPSTMERAIEYLETKISNLSDGEKKRFLNGFTY